MIYFLQRMKIRLKYVLISVSYHQKCMTVMSHYRGSWYWLRRYPLLATSWFGKMMTEKFHFDLEDSSGDTVGSLVGRWHDSKGFVLSLAIQTSESLSNISHEKHLLFQANALQVWHRPVNVNFPHSELAVLFYKTMKWQNCKSKRYCAGPFSGQLSLPFCDIQNPLLNYED